MKYRKGTTITTLADFGSKLLLIQRIRKLHSDNGLIEHLGDEHDIIYMSDAKSSFCNKKDDLEFKITSALTYDESVQLGIVNMPCLSTPVNMASGDGVLQVCNTLTGHRPRQSSSMSMPITENTMRHVWC